MSTHKATPEQWEDAGAFASDTRACLLELRCRIAALEAAANSSASLTRSNILESPDSSPAPAGGLVERVAEAIHDEAGSCHATIEAEAAILAVAHWLDQPHNAYGALHAKRLREEVECG